MSTRPDFGTMSTRELLISVAQSHWDLKERLLGNGQPGLCAIRGCELDAMKRWRERLIGYLRAIGIIISALFALVVAALHYLAGRRLG